jgi:putative heme transporter
MTDLDPATPLHTSAPRGCSPKRSAGHVGFSRCPHQVQQQAAARSPRPSIHVGLPSTAPAMQPAVQPVALAHVAPRAVSRRAPVIALVTSITVGTTIASIRWPHLGAAVTSDVRRLNGAWVLPALALAAVSMLSAALEQRRVLRAGGLSLPLRSMVGITLAGNAVSVTLPLAGSTAGTAFTYLQLKKRGADVPSAAWALATSGLISTIVLAVVLGVGAGVTGDGTTSVVGAVAVLLGIVPIAVVLMSFRSPMVRAHAERFAERVIERLHRTRHRAEGVDAVAVSRAFERMALFRLGWHAGATACVYSAVNWVTDIACLAVCVSALGVPVPWTHLVIVYGATLGAASLSFTPAGIGIVESAITVALVQSGVPMSAAIVAALLYRAVSCWLVLGIGWVSYATMRGSNFTVVEVAA